jgi:hypothetical protein
MGLVGVVLQGENVNWTWRLGWGLKLAVIDTDRLHAQEFYLIHASHTHVPYARLVALALAYEAVYVVADSLLVWLLILGFMRLDCG